MSRIGMGSRMIGPSGGNPYEADDGITDLQDAVLGLLEDAGIPTEVNDQIVRLIEAAERALYEAALSAGTGGQDAGEDGL